MSIMPAIPAYFPKATTRFPLASSIFQPLEDVNHASNPSVFSEGNRSLSTCVVHLLIVDTPDILLKHRIEQIHVVALCLDRVREETESLVPHQSVNWNLLHTKDDRCIRNVFLDSCSCVSIHLHGVGSSVGRLNQHLDPLLDQLANVLRSKGGSSFPHRLGL